MSSLIILIPSSAAFGVSFLAGSICGHFELFKFAIDTIYYVLALMIVELFGLFAIKCYFVFTRDGRHKFNEWLLMILAGMNIGLLCGFIVGYGQYALDRLIFEADTIAKQYVRNKFQ